MGLGFGGTNLDKQDFNLVDPVIRLENIPASADSPLNFTKSLPVPPDHLIPSLRKAVNKKRSGTPERFSSSACAGFTSGLRHRLLRQSRVRLLRRGVRPAVSAGIRSRGSRGP